MRKAKPQETVTLAEAEFLAGISRSTIYRKIASGELKTVERGDKREIESAELVRFINDKNHVGVIHDV